MRRLRRHFAKINAEAWAEFLAALAADPTEAGFGRNLWRIGLVPDLGPDPMSRLEKNRVTTRAISRPTRPAATIDDRMTAASLRSGAWRGPLRNFLDEKGALLANPRVWTREIAETNEQFSFHLWEFADVVREDLDSLSIKPFTDENGNILKSSKLKAGADGQALLEVSEEVPSPVVVEWTTEPAKVAAVAKWRLDVLRPADQRADDDEALASATVAGRNRRGTVKVTASEDDLAAGTHFVVVVTAVGEHGEEVDLTSGALASAESQEFQILVGEPPESKTRRSAAPSVPEAIVRAALEGADDLTEDQVSWDLDSQVFGFRLGNRRSVQVRVNDIIVQLQGFATANPRHPAHYVAQAEYGSVLQIDPAQRQELTLPPALLKARAEFLTMLAESGPRNTVESSEWTPALRDAARAFAASYKRALDSAADEALSDLLLMDTASIDVRRNDEWVYAVVVLPIHPLRATWAVTYDEVMRDWAAQLKELPKNARSSSLSRDLISQVVPANLPFTVRHIGGATAVYAEELTFAAGLNLVPSRLDRDTAAEAISTVLGTERKGSTMKASSRLVEERIAAYERSHSPGNALRLLAINPGSGELLAGALPAVQESDPDDGDDGTERRRIEVIAYSENSAYVRPVPAIANLQNEFRKQKSSRGLTHLAPMFSLAVRHSSALLDTGGSAHLAVLQDPGAAAVGLSSATERKPAFRDLLVPLVTDRSDIDNALVWSAVPATGPQNGGGDGELSVIHRSHQRAMGRALGAASDAVPAIQVRIDSNTREQIRAAHARADWVIGTDKFVGVNLFEIGLEDPYVLDYAPDFVEGIGDRLTVTTTHREEIEHLLDMAMNELGLEAVGGLTSVLDDLSVVSGRLALRLLENTTQAREAVSLAALVSHLRKRGELEDIIVVPVDAHPEIFGVATRDEGSARRCDLLLVKLGQRSFKIDCVEVKSRKEAHLAQALADQILEQLEETKRVLESRYFADEPRVDAEVQTARLTSLLHYYADRSYAHALITEERLPDIHRYIDRIGQSAERAEIAMKGYVVSLDGDQGFKKKYGDVPIQVLTAGDLGQIGFTTIAAREAAAAGNAEETPTPGAADVTAVSETTDATASSRPVHQGPPPSADASRPPDDEAEQLRAGGDNAVPSSAPALRTAGEVTVTLGQDAGGSPVSWRVSTTGSPHAFVIGIPGQGKSVTTRKIIRDFAAGGLPSLVFDFHGDMAADPPAGAVLLNAAAGLPFSPFDPDTTTPRPINSTAWEIAEVLAYVASLGEIQRTHVYQALQQVYSAHGWSGAQTGKSLPTLAEFSEVLGEVESGSAGKNARGRLLPFTDFGLFSDQAEGGFHIRADPPHGWVIDVSQLMEEVQRVAASFILRRVYREMFSWGQDHTMKLAVVLDEAHRMAKDVTLPKIMKEGRKYGVGVLVASQSADDFHTDVVGNAGTKIIFRTNFPASKAVSNMLRGRHGVDLSQEIEKLGVGVAYVSTPDAVRARKVYMAR